MLKNNLSAAVSHGDRENIAALQVIVLYAYNEMPGDCWGSPERVAAWLQA